MDADRLVDVLTLLVRSNELRHGTRVGLLALELIDKLAAEYDGFPELRLQIELRHPAAPFARLLAAGRPAVPLPPHDPVVHDFLGRVLATGRYRVAHLGGIVNRHPGEFHLTLAEHPFPVSVGYRELLLLADWVRTHPAPGPFRILEIGTGFGLSSAFLGCAAAGRPGGGEVVTVDPFVEDRQTDRAAVGDAPAAADVADNLSFQSAEALRREFPEANVRQVLDYSPRCFADPAVLGGAFDLLFIDGNHFDGQPTADFDGAVGVARPDALFVLHDGHAPGVERLLARLADDAWEVTRHPTSCNLVTVRRRD